MRIQLTTALAILGWMAAPVFGASCESLSALALPDAKITAAQLVPAGSFTPPGEQRRGLEAYQTLPEFCRVSAILTPSSDSDIKVEVWLPTSTWNGKFQAVGNGGWAGTISYSALAAAVKSGYAGASTDTGHVGGSGSFALGHPEKLTDFSWRSEHEMAIKAKAIILTFYGSAPSRSYWNGCSTGGRQGFKEAQKFPDDFDGIVAGAPANRTPLGLWIAFAMLKDKGSFIPASKYPLIHQAALNACDAQDGVKDGLIANPTGCKFDPQDLLCQGADAADCLTAPQVEAARKVYAAGKNPRTGQVLFSPLARGSELGWGAHGGGPEPSALSLDQFRYVVYKDPNWDWRTFSFDSDYARFVLPENLPMNATDPNLKAFFARDGKLLVYHGWSDAQVSPFATIQYYQSVTETMGGVSKTSGNVRLFMAPGMGHCGGGDGPNVFDAISALDQWVEQGKAPERIEASQSSDGKVIRTRPLCPYPQEAVYTGKGSIDEAANFVCKVR
jgi:feruloyl esterase